IEGRKSMSIQLVKSLAAMRAAKCLAGILMASVFCPAQTDPGPRGGAAGAGGVIAGLTTKESKFFIDGQSRFAEIDTVTTGLGPRFNHNSCVGCHAQPASGGSSPV